MSATMLDIARRGREHNLLILPAANDGRKFAQTVPLYRTPDGRTTWRVIGNKPLMREDGTGQEYGWKVFRDEPPDDAMLYHLLSGPEVTGVVYICGRASGGLEMWETEDHETWARVGAAMEAAGLGPVWQRMTGGLHEVTPGGGHHTYSRCAVFEGNLMLARRPRANGKHQILIESRGEGGLSVAAPSHGTVHPTGKPYELISGGMETIATITPEERAAMLAVFRDLDEMPVAPPRPEPSATPRQETDGLRPGDDFNVRGDWDRDVLTPAGWAYVQQVGDRRHYRHPDTTAKWSGNVRDDLLYVFTSSTALEPNRAYTKFGAYTHLHHAGDFQAAARALMAAGYGEQAPTLDFTIGGKAVGDTSPSAECAKLVESLRQELARVRAENGRLRTTLRTVGARVRETQRTADLARRRGDALTRLAGNRYIGGHVGVSLAVARVAATAKPDDVRSDGLFRLRREEAATIAGVSEDTVSRAVGALEAAKIIVKDNPYATRAKDDPWRKHLFVGLPSMVFPDKASADLKEVMVLERIARLAPETKRVSKQGNQHGGERPTCSRCGPEAVIEETVTHTWRCTCCDTTLKSKTTTVGKRRNDGRAVLWVVSDDSAPASEPAPPMPQDAAIGTKEPLKPHLAATAELDRHQPPAEVVARARQALGQMVARRSDGVILGTIVETDLAGQQTRVAGADGWRWYSSWEIALVEDEATYREAVAGG